MSVRKLLVSDLVSRVRSLLDEDSSFAIDDTKDILPALNAGQDNASSLLAKLYDSPLITSLILPAANEFPIPEDALEDRLEAVEASQNGYFYALTRVEYRELASIAQIPSANVPTHYAVVGRTVITAPRATGTYELKLWYAKEPAPLTKELGRITLTNTTSNYVSLDILEGAELSSASDTLESYVNVIDKNTGIVKGTLQIAQVNGQRVSFRAVPTRAVVQDRAVLGSLLATGAEVDDYLCPVEGTCVVAMLKKPVSNYLVQYAVTELTRKLGGESDKETAALKELERQIERTWAGRESSLRVKKIAKSWDSPRRRFRSSSR